MGQLGDVQPGRFWVDCASCKRSGHYIVASGLRPYGPDPILADGWLGKSRPVGE